MIKMHIDSLARQPEDRVDRTQGGKLEKDEPIDVIFFGEHSLQGIVETVGKLTTTIVFGKASGGWSVTVPLHWIRRREDRWFLDLA